VILVQLILLVHLEVLLVPFVTLVSKPWGANSTEDPNSAWDALEKRGDRDLEMQVAPTAPM
jgi:hypothetical protein